MNKSHVLVSYLQYTHENIETVQSNAAIEAPVSLTVNGQVWLTFQCTPSNIEALAIGFLFNEGFLQSIEQVENIHVCEQQDNVDVWLNHSVQKPVLWRRTSGCHGGISSAEMEQTQINPITKKALLHPEQIFHLMDQFLNEQMPHSESGGVHTSALADKDTQLFQICDIGRHNTFDKISGKIIMERLSVRDPVLLTSGRISSDMLEKSVRMGVPFLISMRSVSKIGINLADQYGITLIGGARRGRFNLYSHAERILSK